MDGALGQTDNSWLDCMIRHHMADMISGRVVMLGIDWHHQEENCVEKGSCYHMGSACFGILQAHHKFSFVDDGF